jgi:cell division septal protein FtsQ
MPKRKKKNLFLRLFIFREIRSLVFGKSYLIKLILLTAILAYCLINKEIFIQKSRHYYQEFILKKIEKNHQIDGIERGDELEIKRIITQYSNNIYQLKDKIKQLTWIDDVSIRRDLENKSLIIKIEEYQPFAIYEKNGKKILIDKDGENIKNYENEIFDNMIFLKGVDADKNVKSLINIVSINYHLGKSIYSATWIGNRRWDIRLDNNILIKLPEKKIQEALDKLLEIYQTPGSLLGLEIIDLRVANKIYLRYIPKTFQHK